MKKQVVHKLLLFLFVFIAIAFVNSSKTLAMTLPSRMWVDTPKSYQTINTNSFDISGWALNASGINNVRIYIDGAVKGNAIYGLSRPDVGAVFQGYTNGNKSGFTYRVDVNKIRSGKHKITVCATGNDGTSKYINLYVYIAKKAPQMYLETPAKSATTGTYFDVGGWSLNPSGVKAVHIYIDGNFISTAKYGFQRNDVNAVFPGYPNGNQSGFRCSLNVNNISPGAHKLSVVSIGNDGSRQTIDQTVNIIKKSPNMCIDYPTNNFSTDINDTSFEVGGWSLNPSGVKAVQIYIDGNFISTAKYGFQRNDVNAAFPGYPNGNLSGFRCNVNVNNISPGAHKLSVISIGNDGSKQTIDQTVNIIKKSPIMSIDYPTDNFSTTINNTNLNVVGWSLNPSGVKSVQIYLNDKFIGYAKYGLQRNDVNTAFPNYPNASTSGFSFSLDLINYIPSGTQTSTLKVVSIGNDGTNSTMTKDLIITKLPERICVDTPNNNDTVKNNINITGWALHSSGIKSVNVYLDGVFNGSADYGSDRPDVNSAYPGYADGSKSGFNYNLDTSKLSMGSHTIRVDSIGNDGIVASQSIIINFYGIVKYEYFNYTLDYMTNIQLSVGAVYQNTTTWTWDPANYNMIRQYVDSSNIVNDSYAKYEFLKLSYYDGVSVTDLNNILKDKGVLANKGQVFLEAAEANNVNPIYLISHALLETGNGTSNLATGILVSPLGKTPKVTYNLFGIGAYDRDPDKYGSQYAYDSGWYSIDAAIRGGAAFISQGYINSSTNQDTLYKMRWNPAAPGTHQYATDVRWAYNQIYNIKKLIDQCSNSTLYFNIPVFI